MTPALPTTIRAKDLHRRLCRRQYGRRICVAVFSDGDTGEGFASSALPTRIRAKDLCHRPCRRRYGRRICVAVFSDGDTGEEFASSALPMAIRAKDLQLACLSSVVPLSVCLFLSVFLLIAVYPHRSSIVASFPPRSKAPAQPSRAPWLSPRHLGETETTIYRDGNRQARRKEDRRCDCVVYRSNYRSRKSQRSLSKQLILYITIHSQLILQHRGCRRVIWGEMR